MIDVVVAHDHTIGITPDHRALIWGSKEYLFDGGYVFPYDIVPQRIPKLRKVQSACATQHINVFLTQDGLVFERGYYNHITHTIEESPAQVAGLPEVVSIAVGSSHRLALSEDGEVWSWGDWNLDGQLGTGDKEARIKPVKVEGLPKIAAISAGSWHSMALDTDGNIWVWGSQTATGNLEFPGALANLSLWRSMGSRQLSLSRPAGLVRGSNERRHGVLLGASVRQGLSYAHRNCQPPRGCLCIPRRQHGRVRGRVRH